MLFDLIRFIIAPIVVGGVLELLRQLVRRWLDDKGNDKKRH